MPIVFTRYLYIKDEVEIALTTSILEKKDDAIFWAYELYYSGYENDTFDILWKIYHYFFASLNPCFETYFIKKHQEWMKRNSNELDFYISTIVSNLIIRPFNLDVFILHKINTHLDIEEDDTDINFTALLTMSSYVAISKYILEHNDSENLTIIMEKAIDHFAPDKKTKLMKEWDKIKKFRGEASMPLILMSRIMMFYSSKKMPKGKSFYVIIEPEDTIMYETIMSDKKSYSPYKILPMACLYTIDKYNYLSLFMIARKYEANPMTCYYYHWLYYASYSPVWSTRIKTFNGMINHETKQVTFAQEDDEESFHDNYGYEPDEQKISTQQKNIQPIKQDRTWASFYNTHKSAGLFQDEDEVVSYLEDVKLFE
jgi:hypothetical protein